MMDCPAKWWFVFDYDACGSLSDLENVGSGLRLKTAMGHTAKINLYYMVWSLHFKPFCIVHHYNKMLSSFRFTYAHAPYWQFLLNHTAQAINHNSLGIKAVGQRLNQHAQDAAELNPSTIMLWNEGRGTRERQKKRKKQTKTVGWKREGFGNQGRRIATAHLIKSLCLLIGIMMYSYSLRYPHSSSLSLGGKSGITAAFQRSQSSRHHTWEPHGTHQR